MPRVTEDYLAARRDHILDAAAVRFAREGFHRTSMQDVIAEAGLSPGAVYRYFRSKDEIIMAISTRAVGIIERVVHDALADQLPVGEVVARVPAAVTELDGADDHVRLAVQVWGEALRNAAIGGAIRAGLDRLRRELQDRIEAARRDGAVAADVDPEAAANVLLATVQGFILQRAWRPGLPADSYGDAVRDVVAGRLAG